MAEDDVSRTDHLVLCDTAIEHMLKGGASMETTYRVLSLLYRASPANAAEFSDDYVRENIMFIHEHLLRIDDYAGVGQRNIQQEVEDLLAFRGSTGARLSDIYNDLKLTEKQEKTASRVALQRLMSKKIVEKVDAGKTGMYRVINRELDEVRFLDDTDDSIQTFPIKLPLGLNDLCSLYAKNIIIVAGSKSAGKTALLLNIAIANQHNIPVTYFNSEMGDVEYTQRMKNFGFTSQSQIKFKVYNRFDNYSDVINGNKSIYIIDFLEIHDNFYEVAKPIRAIHEKLKDGIAIIAIQKKDGQSLGRGAEFSMEKSRLYLTMDFDETLLQTKVRIADAKFPRVNYPVRGLYRNIKVIGGHKLSPVDDSWRR